MNRILLAAACAAFAAACTPDIEKTEAPTQVTARFDPSQSPPVVPTPNDLAENPVTGSLAVTPSPTATEADIEFTGYLNTLNGFPASSTAKATFDAKLDPASVTSSTVRVFDITDPANIAAVADAAPVYSDQDDVRVPGAIEVSRPIGWTPGRRYLVAIVGGSGGVKGANGENVVASSTFSFLKAENPLVTGCAGDDVTSADCRSVTAAIPSTETDPAAQVADRNAKAARLEGLRRKYKSSVDHVIANGVSRGDLALLWSFRVSDNVAVVFDPAAAVPKVPRPNDLAISRTTGLVTAPIDPSTSPANQEFTRDYLNSLNGFPITAQASAAIAGGDLDPASVTTSSVKVLDLTPGATQPASTVSYDATKKLILINPPTGGWQKAHQYAVFLVSGTDANGAVFGLKSTTGKPVATSQVWALVRAAAPVDELTLVELLPAQVASLTQLQASYEPLLAAAVAQGFTREEVVLGWTFRTLNHPEATLDLQALPPVIPFPNSLAMSADGGTLALPNPGANPLIAGLNTLDGFSLTAPIVSENSATLGALTENARVNESTLADGGWVILPLSGAGPTPNVRACINCALSLQSDGGVQNATDTLQFVPVTPLAERTTYGMAVKTAVKDTTGRSVRPVGTFALLRMENPLVDANGKSLVDGVSDGQAALLEPRRQAFKPFIDALVASGHPRKELALGWTFRTQTVNTALKQLAGVPALLGTATTADYITDITANVPAIFRERPAGTAVVSKVYQGTFLSPFLLTGTGGTIGTPRVDRLTFTLSIPSGTAPATGWPVVIFGHGLAGFRSQSLAIIATLAQARYATIFIDAPFHGDRSSCAGIASVTPSTADTDTLVACSSGTCDVAPGSLTNGYCVGAVRANCTDDTVCAVATQGRCLADGKCAAGAFRTDTDGQIFPTALRAWNFINTTNLFATRDNFRQQVVDLTQLARVVSQPSSVANSLNARLAADANAPLNGAQINYAGISLGGILGSLYTSVSPDVHRAVLNVPGGDPTGILLEAPAFAQARAGFLATLAAQGVLPGTPAYDQFLYFARTILDPADPQNVGYDLMNGTGLPADRAVLIQYITRDQVIPNTVTDKLIAAATRTDAPKKAFVFKFDPPDADLALAGRHGFLLNGTNLALTGQVQTQLATFLVTGAQP